MRLDTSEWKQFRFGDLIDQIYRAQAYSKAQLDDEDRPRKSYVPFVSRTESNNGVDCYVPINQVAVETGNAIVIGDTTSTISYQPEPFSTGDHIVVVRASWLNPLTGLFVVSLLERERFRYSYGRAFVMLSIKNTQLSLPSTSDGKPDWQWMEDYIKSLHSRPITTSNRGSSSPTLGARPWGDFRVSELFEVKYGINMELNTCDETTREDPEGVAFVARTAENNGISAYVKPVEGKMPQPAHTITVAGGGSVLSAFLQRRPFYSGRDLYLLLPKENIGDYAKLFVVTVLRAEKYRFNYGRQANKTLPYLNLHLPITDEGAPDWKWMEGFMRSLPYGDRIVESWAAGA